MVEGKIEGIHIILLSRGATESDGFLALFVLHFEALKRRAILVLSLVHVLIKSTGVVWVICGVAAWVEFALKKILVSICLLLQKSTFCLGLFWWLLIRTLAVMLLHGQFLKLLIFPFPVHTIWVFEALRLIGLLRVAFQSCAECHVVQSLLAPFDAAMFLGLVNWFWF